MKRAAAPMLGALAGAAACAPLAPGDGAGPAPAPIEWRSDSGLSQGSDDGENPAPENDFAQAQTRPQTRARAPAPIDLRGSGGKPLTAEEAFAGPPGARPATHTVKSGETLYIIATRYQIALRDLIEANDLQPPYALKPGLRLKLPPAATHLVKRGETLSEIAARYNVDLRSLALLNRLRPPYRLEPGQTIYLPTAARAAPDAPAQAAPPPAAAGPARFVWPLEGEIAARFGRDSRGRRQDGINIAVAAPGPVRAADAGLVAYAGDDLPGYGHLVLIQHAGGWVTAYAQLGAINVRDGARVKRGDVIGAAAAPVLHFQVRQPDGDAVDPLRHLPPRN